jgi:hypothetical protein
MTPNKKAKDESETSKKLFNNKKVESESSTPKLKSLSMAEKSGILFPPLRIKRQLKKGLYFY